MWAGILGGALATWVAWFIVALAKHLLTEKKKTKIGYLYSRRQGCSKDTLIGDRDAAANGATASRDSFCKLKKWR